MSSKKVGQKTRQTGQGGDDDREPPPTKVVVMVGEQGFNLIVNDDRQILPRRPVAAGGAAGYDFAGLQAALQKVKATLPDQDDLQVRSEDTVAFETLIATMDSALAAGFPALSLD